VLDALALAQLAAGLPATVTCADATCSITGPPPPGPLAGHAPLAFDLALSPTGPGTADCTVEFSTDGGGSFLPACAAPLSLLPNPATGVPGGSHELLWDIACDFAGPATGVITRIVLSGGCGCQAVLDVDDSLLGPLQAGSLILSEIHADPDPTLAGDANGDGVRSATEDEFVELVNLTLLPLNLSGVEIADAVGVRHTVPPGTVLPPGRALVVFGGGTPTGTFGGAVVQTASSGTLGLNNGSDILTITSPSLVQLDQHAYGPEAEQDQSILWSPEPTSYPTPGGGGGIMVVHSSVNPALLYSPGTRADGVTPVW
jgi:hypothetical protein